jgi:hypothetical protein
MKRAATESFSPVVPVMFGAAADVPDCTYPSCIRLPQSSPSVVELLCCSVRLLMTAPVAVIVVAANVVLMFPQTARITRSF